MTAKRGSRAGAAAFLLGLSLAAPHTTGVAAADDTDTGSSSGSASAARAKSGPARASRAARAARTESRSVERVPSVQSIAPRTGRPVPSASAAVRGDNSRDTTRSTGVVANEIRPRASATVAAAHNSGAAADQPSVQTVKTPVPEPVRVAAPARVRAAPAAAADAGAPTASATSGTTGCPACWGVQAPTLGQAVNTVINNLFNSAFDLLSALPGSPISNLLEGALVLVRRSLFLSPLGVTASQVGTDLTVSVNTGSVAYFRQDGTTLEVSGVPSFRRAQRFDAATVSKVEAANPGNAGCAGLVLDSGVISADLKTTQIDSIRFDSGAAFTEKVSAAVTGGPLTVRSAVRGFKGVTLDAVVVLGNDVEVDAGSGDARFTGTVDAAEAGEQSLTVTALRSTTFEAAVGGQAALAGLLARAIAPITIQQSDDSKTIPLHYLPEYSAGGQPQVKYGIDVAIGDNPSQMYEFDTGGVAFFAGYNRQFWQNVPLTTTGISEVYSSGNYYDGVVANTPITIGTGAQTVSTVQPIQIAAVLAGGNANNQTTFDFSNPDAPPVEDRFFGDFGASFATLPVNGLDTPLVNPLFELPGNLSSGFLVQLGPIGTDPQLTVGVTDELRAQFPYAVPLQALAGGDTYPVSGLPVLEWFAFAPSYYAQFGGAEEQPIGVTPYPQCATQCLPTLIDSGGPSTGIRLKGGGGNPYDVDNQLQPGVNFIARFPTTEGRPALEWTYVAGNNGSVDLVEYQQGSPSDGGGQNLNTGLNLYNAFDVMFDVKKQVIWLRPTGGQSTVNLQSVTTTGDQTYQQSATLAGAYTTGGGFSIAGTTVLLDDTVINAGGGGVRFSGTVNGGYSLGVNGTGATEFMRGVGGLDSLTSLTTDAGGSTATSGVLTTGAQTYNDDVSLNGRYQVGNGASFAVAGDTTLAGPVSVEVPEGDITFTGTADALPGKGLTLTLTTGPGHHILLAADVGATNPLGGLAVLNPNGTSGDPAGISADGSVTLIGSLGFAAAQGISIDDFVTTTLAGGGQVQGFTGDGISLGASQGSRVSGFIVSNNGGDGIAVRSADDLVLENNAIIANGGDGLDAVGVNTASPGVGSLAIIDSSILSNGLNGVRAVDMAALTVSGATIDGNGIASTDNPLNGIQLIGSNNVTIDGSAISGNANDGILSSRSDTVSITDNVIKGNTGSGVTVDSGIGNSILSNSIVGNGPSSPTTNCGITLENGGNDNQPAPIVESATFVNGMIEITGTLSLPGTPNGTYQVQVFYSVPVYSDPITIQGQQLLGEVTVQVIDLQPTQFSASFASPQPNPGNYVTATATPVSGAPNTSSFSAAVLVGS